MQILTENGFKEVDENEVIGAYAIYMMMPLERARNYFKVFMKGATPFPVQGLGFVIPPALRENLEIA